MVNELKKKSDNKKHHKKSSVDLTYGLRYKSPKNVTKSKEVAFSLFIGRHGVLIMFVFLIVIFGGFYLIGIIGVELQRKNNSGALDSYTYNNISRSFQYNINIIDKNLIMTPIIEKEIMRIKQEVNSELKYGKSKNLPVSWLNNFDSKGQKPVADCDDFAYLFWEKAQSSRILKDKIFFAVSDDAVFAHAFNLIWVGGEWRSIEPQNLERVLGLSYDRGYVNVSNEAFTNWINKHKVLIYKVNDMQYTNAVVQF
jgi:hypothetical protein